MSTNSALSLALRSMGETLLTIAGEIEKDASTPDAPVNEGAPGLLGRAQLAKVLGVSLATIDRACLQGLPYSTVGTRRRFELAAVRAWFTARGKAPTTSERRDPEVDRIASRGGLRRA